MLVLGTVIVVTVLSGWLVQAQLPQSSQQQASPPSPAASAEGQPVTVHGDTAQPQPVQTQAYTLSPEKLAKAVALNRIRVVLDFADSLWGLAVVWLLLVTRAAAGLAAWCERRLARRWLQGLLFFAVLLVVTSVAGMPLDAIGHQVSLHYGLSVQGWGGWLADQAKELGLLVVIGGPVLLFFNWIVRVSPRRYWAWGWVISLPLMALAVFAAPLLDPVFSKFEPLAQTNPGLVAKLEKVVARTGTKIPAERIYLMNASAKYTGLNAYVTGIGATKRIVVWDTTAGHIPDDEILFIFGHESGHYVLHHIPKSMAGSAVGLFFVFWACSWVAARVAKRWGQRWGVVEKENRKYGPLVPLASRQGFVLLLFTLAVASFLLEPVSNTFSRHFEHEADIYGQEAIHGLVADPQKTAVASFNALGEAWLEDPSPNLFIEFWCYSHPSVERRASFALHYNPWVNGGRGTFFAQ
jgi:Zn-dependent protease with chaperone function